MIARKLTNQPRTQEIKSSKFGSNNESRLRVPRIVHTGNQMPNLDLILISSGFERQKQHRMLEFETIQSFRNEKELESGYVNFNKINDENHRRNGNYA